MSLHPDAHEFIRDVREIADNTDAPIYLSGDSSPHAPTVHSVAVERCGTRTVVRFWANGDVDLIVMDLRTLEDKERRFLTGGREEWENVLGLGHQLREAIRTTCPHCGKGIE